MARTIEFGQRKRQRISSAAFSSRVLQWIQNAQNEEMLTRGDSNDIPNAPASIA
jgi:hypothetical protein